MRSVARSFMALLFAVAACLAVDAKETPFWVVTWPSSEHPFVRLSFSKARETGSAAHERSYSMDVTAENLWGKPIKNASFEVYFFDKANVRISTGNIYLNNVGIGETVKFPMMFAASGLPASMKLAPDVLPDELGPAKPPHTVSLTVNSVPQGATLRIDGKESGTTPQLVQLPVGKHDLEFSREGFNPGHFAVNVGPNDASGGSVSYELGTAAHDTILLRDGTVVTGDLQDVTATEVRITVGGTNQTLDRNKVKRILLIERNPPQ